jgi:hypothetical protein
MKQRPRSVERTQEELNERFRAWARLMPAEDDGLRHYAARQAAWHRYCDARDGLPDGASSEAAQGPLAKGEQLSQLDMFRRRQA